MTDKHNCFQLVKYALFLLLDNSIQYVNFFMLLYNIGCIDTRVGGLEENVPTCNYSNMPAYAHCVHVTLLFKLFLQYKQRYDDTVLYRVVVLCNRYTGVWKH